MELQLPLLALQPKIRVEQRDGKRYLWGLVRRKWLVLQPEELVRQLLLHHFIDDLGINKNRLAVERGLSVNGLQKRCDLLVFDPDMNPWLLVECKAPAVSLTEATFRQIATYNLPLQVPHLLVCNGPQAYCCSVDWEVKDFAFLERIPAYPG
ncbi:MAG: type I restriction enzyme HsdR N-terminal domain-containing protein [Bacteroidota bacterium]